MFLIRSINSNSRSRRMVLLIALAVMALLIGLSVWAQSPEDIVKWTAYVSPQSAKPGDNVTVTLVGMIEEGWHIYSITQVTGGPTPTTIRLPDQQVFKLAGPIACSEPEKIFDPNFGMNTETHAERVAYKLPISVNSRVPGGRHELTIAVRFQACNEQNCLPPTTLTIKTGITIVKELKKSSAETAKPPSPLPLAKAAVELNALGTTNGIGSIQPSPVGKIHRAQVAFAPPHSMQSFRSFLWLAVVMGALSLLTPCVFPMIPITVSYFTNHAGLSRKNAVLTALVYGIGIILAFTALGMLLAAIFGAGGVNQLAANPWINLLITVIFLGFALSLFGAYFIQIPPGLINKLNTITCCKEGTGIVGALLTGFAFTLTSFTCTAPFVGTLLVMTAQGNWRWPLAGMLAFSTVFAIPFFILALAPQLMSQLPKAGGWMEQMKVVMGFLEIAAAMKFLSNADLVWSWGIFTRQAVLAVWVGIGFLTVLYILGCFRMTHDSPVESGGAIRVMFAIFFLVLTIWLIPGLFGRQLGELESFLPPKLNTSTTADGPKATADTGWIMNDYEGALVVARRENKPLFVDFTGYTCTNCRWMEANMFPRPEVAQEMDRLVRVRLYTDGYGELYQQQQKMQQEKFGTVALPYYAILQPDGTVSAAFSGLTRNVNEFTMFLRMQRPNSGM
jgi:thiol:disulfide interchange protein